MGGIYESTPRYNYPPIDDPRFPKFKPASEVKFIDEVGAPTHSYPYKPSLGDKIENLIGKANLMSGDKISEDLIEILIGEGLDMEKALKIKGRTGHAIAQLLEMSKSKSN